MPLLCREALPGLGQHGPRSSNAGSFLGPAAGVRTTSLSSLVWDTTMMIATARTSTVGCAAATLGGRQITSVGGSSSLSAYRSSMQRGLIACGIVLCRGCRRHSWARPSGMMGGRAIVTLQRVRRVLPRVSERDKKRGARAYKC